MHFGEADRLLDPAPMALEMGYERLDDGVLHVACRTNLRGCTGRMFAWWFSSLPQTERYRWWHPVDHLESRWTEVTAGHVGAVHKASERFGGGPPANLSIQFHDPATFFSAPALDLAYARKNVSALVVARASESDAPRRTPRGEMIGSRLVHACRDTEWGMVLRSHFFLGHDLPQVMARDAVIGILPDAMAPALLQHCHEEFLFLADFLPAIYRAEGVAAAEVVRPW